MRLQGVCCWRVVRWRCRAAAVCSRARMPAPQSYVLRLPPRPPHGGTTPSRRQPAACNVPRPGRAWIPSASRCCAATGASISTRRVALGGARARSAWRACIVDQLRGAGLFAGGVRRCRRRTRRATTCAADCAASRPTTPRGGRAPTVQVALDCTFGRHRDRTLLAQFHRAGSAPAGDDRLGAVVAAFESRDRRGRGRAGTAHRRGARRRAAARGSIADQLESAQPGASIRR